MGFFERSALPLPQVSMDDLQEKQARARALEESGDADAALGLYRELLSAEPDRAPVYLRTAALHEACGARDEASADYARAADLFASAGLTNLGLVALRHLLRVDPERAEAYRSFGELSAGQGFILDARRGFLQFAERAVAAGQAEVAVGALQSCLEQFPGDSVIRDRLAELGGEPPAEPESEPEMTAEPDLPEMAIEPTSLVEQEEEPAGTPAAEFETLPLEGFEPTQAEPEPEAVREEAAEAEDGVEPEAEPLPIIGYGPAEELGAEEPGEDEAGEEEAIEALPLLGFDELGAPETIEELEAADETAEPLPMLDEAAVVETSAPEPEVDDYVDLGALVLPGSVPSDVDAAADAGPTPEQDLAEILALLPDDGAGEPIDPQEAANHYDLGLAFKEMGLLNEAVAELRRALLGGANPLATLEVLGECLAIRGEPELAARLLERAMRLEGAGEEELVGVVYWLARCHAELGRDRRARSAFEWVASVDADFRDTAERIRALGSS